MSANRNTLLVRMKLDLTKDSVKSIVHGPLFHRWLPDGENDSITLLQSPGGTNLRVWFDRCGFVDNNFIQFETKRRDVDSNIMNRQGLLQAGPLNAELRLPGIDDETISVIRSTEFNLGQTDPKPAYEKIGKQVSKLIGPHLYRFTQLLVLNYGQYWLEPWPQYDSTIHATLGSYFSNCNAKWKCVEDKKWMRFIPSPCEMHFTADIPSRFGEYLSESDWALLDELARAKAEPSQAVIAVTHANELIGENRHRHALIVCVTAFELAFAERVRRIQGTGTPLDEKLAKQQAAMNMMQRMLCIAAFVDSVSKDQIKLALEAIVDRNEVVHKGWNPKNQSQTTRRVEAMLHVCRALIDHHDVRLPRLTSGNVSRPAEAWEAASSSEI